MAEVRDIIAELDKVAAEAKTGTTHADHDGWTFKADRALRCGCGAVIVTPPGYQECMVDGCDSVRTARGMCTKHYGRYLRGEIGLPEGYSPRPKQYVNPCSVADCPDLALTRGLCQKHYSRQLRTGTTDLARTRKQCSECGSPAVARGLCQKHYKRQRRAES